MNEPFGEAVSAGLTELDQGTPWISDDGLALLHDAENLDTYVWTRTDKSAAFEPALAINGYADPYVVGGPDGTLYVQDYEDFFWAPLTDWEPGSFEPLGVTGIRPTVTLDELTLYFSSTGSFPSIRVARRASVDAAFEASENVAVSQDAAAVSWISPDGCRLYFDTWFDAGADLYVMER